MPLTDIKSVFDCNIIWQSFFFANGVSAKCKKLVDDNVISLFISADVLKEMREVMTRPEFLERFENVAEELVDKYLEQLARKSVFVSFVPKKFTFTRDPDDEFYINLAIEVEADYLVSRDRDLLDLMTGCDEESKEFRQSSGLLKSLIPKNV